MEQPDGIRVTERCGKLANEAVDFYSLKWLIYVLYRLGRRLHQRAMVTNRSSLEIIKRHPNQYIHQSKELNRNSQDNPNEW